MTDKEMQELAASIVATGAFRDALMALAEALAKIMPVSPAGTVDAIGSQSLHDYLFLGDAERDSC